MQRPVSDNPIRETKYIFGTTTLDFAGEGEKEPHTHCWPSLQPLRQLYAESCVVRVEEYNCVESGSREKQTGGTKGQEAKDPGEKERGLVKDGGLVARGDRIASYSLGPARSEEARLVLVLKGWNI